MALLFLVGILLVGLAGALAWRAILTPRVRVALQMREIETYGFRPVDGDAQAAALAGSPVLGDSRGVAERIGHFTMRRVPRLKALERRELLAAGMYNTTPETFHGYRVLAAFGVPGLVVAMMLASGSVNTLLVLMIVAMAAILWYLPVTSVRRRGENRVDQIDRDIPELIDVLIATIEAGLGFGASLQLVADRFDGPLGDELRITLQQQTLGISTDVALRNLLERCETPSVRSFVKTMLQGGSLGISVGKMLRNLATETRQRRRGKARERAQRAPIKLLFPLVFLIFPSMFIVLGYPIVYDIIHALNGG
jgi:tight adherence protein C